MTLALVTQTGKSPISLATTPGEVVNEDIFTSSLAKRSLDTIETRSQAHFDDS
jgi:hypothetical protein